MSIRVTHSLDDLASDLRKVATRSRADMVKVVRRNVELGKRTERKIAKTQGGRHSKNYQKRITSEMTGQLSGEWGPDAGGTPVGVGFRHGGGNSDSEASADIVAPKFYRDAHKLPDEWFWPS